MHAFIHASLVASLLVASPAIAGGNHDHGPAPVQPADDGPPSVTVTQWSDELELFMEYPVPVVGEPGQFIIHLTLLDGFVPVEEGSVALRFTAADGSETQVIADQTLREGIFAPTVTLGSVGPTSFELEYSGPSASARFVIEGLLVFPSAEDVPASHAHGTAGEIGFLKEQQWKVPFATATARTREISHSIRAIADVLPAASAYVEIIAPVSGVVRVNDPGDLALPGSWVERGDVVVRIVPPLQGSGWASSEIALAQAERNYERARRLREKDAISQREFEEAENEYRALRARHERFDGSGDSGVLALTAPIDGQIIDWEVRPGQRVEAGDHLMAVADPSIVWLQVNVYESDLDELDRPVGAFIGSGADGWLVPDEDLHVLTTGGSIDPVTRTVPVLLEISHATGRLAINGSTPVELLTGTGEPGIAIPVSALYEEEGLYVVFVQTGGETFEKRVVRLGHRHAGWVRVLDGIQEGERLVVRGGYHVKLASTSAEIGAGHAH